MTLIISRDELRKLLTIEECIPALERAHVEFFRGRVILPVRVRIHNPEQRGSMGLTPAILQETGAMGIKVQCTFERNSDRGLPLITGVVILQDVETGVPLAVMDSAYVTAVRTPAASAMATKYLAREDTRVLAIIGAGVQGRAHLRGMKVVRPIEEVRVVDKVPAAAQAFKAEMEAETGLPITICGTPEEAVRGADLICTTSLSPTPVVEGRWLRPGVHINAVGAHSLQTREVDSDAIAMARIAVDSMEGAQKESGDIMTPVQEGRITVESLIGEIGEIVAGLKPGRQSPEEITLYKALGVGIQDVAAAHLVYRKAVELGMGTRVEM